MVRNREQEEEAAHRAEREAYYRALFEAAGDAVVVYRLTPEGSFAPFVEVNRAACRRYGYTRSELLRMTVRGLVDPAAGPLEPVLDRLLAEGYVLVETVHVTKSGQQLPVEVSSHLFHLDGHTTVLSIIRDLTRRKQAEAALRESEERFRHVADSAPVMIWMMSAEQACTYVNAGWLAFTGRTLEEELGSGWAEGIHPEEKVRCLEAYRSHFARRTPFRMEYRLRRADGVYRWVLDTGAPRFMPDGTFLGFIGSCIDITEIKEAQEERAVLLHEVQAARDEAEAERERLRMLFMQAPAFIASVRGPEHVFEMANALYLQLVGQRDVLGKPVRTALPEVAGQGYFELLDRVYATGEPFVGREMRVLLRRRPDGPLEEVYLDFIYQPVFEPRGVVSGIFVHGVDVTEQVRARQKLEAALLASETGTFRWDIRTGALEWDESLNRLFGLPPGETVHHIAQFTERVHPEDRAEVEAVLARCVGEGADFDLTFRVVWPDGSLHWVSDRGKVFFDDAHRPLYMTGACVDITARKQAEEERERLLTAERAARAEAERRAAELDATIQSMPDAVYIGSEAGITMANEPALTMLGFSSLEELNRNVSELNEQIQTRYVDTGTRIPPDDEVFSRALRGEKAVREVRVRHLGTGEDRILRSAAAPIIVEGQNAGAVAVNTDITERKRYEEELIRAKEQAEAANRAKSTFLASMSHEIRTPLQGVIGYAALLARQVTGQHRRFAELIGKSGERLLMTLNAVLDLARLEADALDVVPAVLDLPAEVRRIIAALQPLAEQKQLELVYRVAPGAENVQVHLDPGMLSSILNNLVGNAIKFTQAGHVLVEVEREVDRTGAAQPAEEGGRHVQIRVQDTGIGIDPDFLPHLFEPFTQESTGLGRSHEGSGLGLAITKRLVERMGGTIRVESEKGAGSTFILSFAAAPAAGIRPDQQDALEAANEAAPEATGLRLLIVEDHPDTTFLLESFLADRYQVTSAAKADEALDLARRTAFDLVLMDIDLGAGKSGAEVMQELRAMPAYREAPIIALTAYALPGDRDRFLEMGFTAYMSKPFNADELLALLSQLSAR